MARKHSPSSSVAVSPRPGGNWKALKKILDNGSSSPTARHKRRRSSSSGSYLSDLRQAKGNARKARPTRDEAPASFSPAPTSLPWFAEDLSPDDLALVQKISHSNSSGATNHLSASPWNTASRSQLRFDTEERLKKRVILGGNDEGNIGPRSEPGQYIAIDCEMVGVGPKGSESVLARVSIVNWHGHVLLDRFVRPMEKVTDYRTWVSGIRAKDLVGAPSLKEVQEEVSELIKGRVLVGHAIQNDLKALLLSHPRTLIRDTSTFKPLRDLAQTKYPGLKKLAKLVLDIDVQEKGQEHSPVEDARTTMAIFRTQKDAWEKSLMSNFTMSRSAAKVGALQPAQSSLLADKTREGEGVGRKIREKASLAQPIRWTKRTESASDWWKEEI